MMKSRYLSLCIFFLHLSFSSVSQAIEDKDYNYFGMSMNDYFTGITPFQIYANDLELNYQMSDRYGKLKWAPGIILGTCRDLKNVQVRMEYAWNTLRSSAAYDLVNPQDSLIYYPVKESLKLNNSQFRFLFCFPLKPLKKRCSIGAGFDFGLVKNRRKQSGDFFTGKYEKFYTSTGLLGDNKGAELTAGLCLAVSFRLSDKFMLSLTRQFLILDAVMNGYAGKSVLMNTQHFQYALSYTF